MSWQGKGKALLCLLSDMDRVMTKKGYIDINSIDEQDINEMYKIRNYSGEHGCSLYDVTAKISDICNRVNLTEWEIDCCKKVGVYEKQEDIVSNETIVVIPSDSVSDKSEMPDYGNNLLDIEDED